MDTKKCSIDLETIRRILKAMESPPLEEAVFIGKAKDWSGRDEENFQNCLKNMGINFDVNIAIWKQDDKPNAYWIRGVKVK